MKITKKVMSLVLAAVMMMGVLAVSVSAESIYDTAVDLPSGEEQSLTLGYRDDQKDYKVTLSKSGTLYFNINASMSYIRLYIYDINGSTILPNEYDYTVGSANIDGDYLSCEWNSITENSKGTVKYELNAGTYYIRIIRRGWNSEGNGKLTFTATYPSDSSGTVSSTGSSGKISYLTLEMEVGETIRLGAVVSPDYADVTWSSSKSRVASVSESGIVTANKAGSAIITAKSGGSVKRIKIIVV